MASNDFGLFFTRDNTVIRLPVNPDKLPVARELDTDEYNVMGIGQIMVARTPNLRTLTISSFFPGRIAPYVLTSGRFEPPEFYIQFFESAMNDGVPILYTPVRYYENGQPFMTGDAGFQVFVTSFSTEERGAETGDFYYDLELTEYRDFTPQQVQIVAQTQASSGTPSQPAQAKTESTREIPANQLYVGAVCTANGNYYASSYGDEPHGNGNGRRCKVSRIVEESTRAYPIHITTESGGALGWVKKESLQVVGV